MPSKHLILCRPLLLLPSIFPSIKVFSNESVLHIRWPKYWSFSFNISPSNEQSRLISFRMDWLALLAVQGTLKSLLQHHSSKASILLCSAFFMVQLSHPYMTTGKTMALTRWTFIGKVMSLLFNMLSRLVITFLPRSKHLSISWLQWSRKENPEIYPHTDGQLINKKGDKNIQQRKDSLFKKWCRENWKATCKRMKLKHSLTHHTEINSKWFEDLTVRSGNTKLQEKNTDIGGSNFFFRSVSSGEGNQSKKLSYKKGNHQQNNKTTTE